jgi:hypothetical protein
VYAVPMETLQPAAEAMATPRNERIAMGRSARMRGSILTAGFDSRKFSHASA